MYSLYIVSINFQLFKNYISYFIFLYLIINKFLILSLAIYSLFIFIVLNCLAVFGLLGILCQSTPILVTDFPQLTPTPKPHNLQTGNGKIRTGFKILIPRSRTNVEENVNVDDDVGITQSPNMKTTSPFYDREELLLRQLLHNHHKRTNRDSDYITVLADCNVHPDWCDELQLLQNMHQ